jgi:hypothetical protein
MIEAPEKVIENFLDYVNIIKKHQLDKKVLYRGQSCDKPLLPKIARLKLVDQIKEVELRMLDDFKREAFPHLESTLDTDWDWLALAQHHGMATRLLDWSSNPLVGLFFAVSEPIIAEEHGVVWIFRAEENDYINPKDLSSPFDGEKTEIFRSRHLSRRIVAQAGLFTAHKYLLNKDLGKKEFIPLDENSLYKNSLTKIIIPSTSFSEIRKSLDKFGINHATLFPDLDGICRSIDRRYSYLSDEKT